jgi:Tfp pilus assembly protein PilX
MMIPRPCRTPGRGDDGVALLTVIGAMIVLMMFLMTSLAFVLQNAPAARRDQDAKAALAAAEAGVEEYVSRLNSDSNYFNNGNVDASNTALVATGTGKVIPGTNGGNASFRYQLLNTPTQIAQTGTIQLQVTGISSPGNGTTPVTRTVSATLKPRGFLRFIYSSDVEVVDPELTVPATVYVTLNGSSSPASGRRYVADTAAVKAACGSYYYAGRSSPSYTVSASTPVKVLNTSTGTITSTITTGGGTVANFSTSSSGTSSPCREIQWTSGDVLQGPFHSNDALQIQGSVLFTDPLVETGWNTTATNKWWGSGTPSSGTTAQPGYRPRYGVPLSLPAGNEKMKQYVEPDVDGDVTTPVGPGCYYTGATRIIFQGTTMKVLSPSTTSAPSRCLDVANRANEQTLAIPPVIYVDSTATPNPSIAGACSTSTGVGYPRTGEDTGVAVTTDYTCTRGTALVQGNVDDQVTVASKDDIVVTGNLTLNDGGTGTDIIGLVAGNYVWVYHPVTSSGNNLLSAGSGVYNIAAAILSLRHSFLVQNWNEGSPLSTTTATKLNVNGSIAQKFRGPVGTGNGTTASTGYLKNYVYDYRLLVLQPPYFLAPDASPWEVNKLSDK